MSRPADPSASTSDRYLSRPIGDQSPRCPNCETSVADTKGDHRTPQEVPGDTTFGFYCSDCRVVMPVPISGPEAAGVPDCMVGRRARFHDGRERFVPVPKGQLE